jgi:hypothetical protein
MVTADLMTMKKSCGEWREDCVWVSTSIVENCYQVKYHAKDSSEIISAVLLNADLGFYLIVLQALTRTCRMSLMNMIMTKTTMNINELINI